jgi:hypothetical protein
MPPQLWSTNHSPKSPRVIIDDYDIPPGVFESQRMSGSFELANASDGGLVAHIRLKKAR